MSSARLHVPSPLLVAATVCPSTVTEIAAVVSSTVPPRAGVASFVSSGVTVITGAAVSTVMSSAAEAALVFPATSVAVVVSERVPSARVVAVMSYTSEARGLEVATLAPSTSNVIVLPESAVPIRVGVLSEVRSSVLELPESLEEARSGVVGTAGAVASIVTDRPVDSVLVFPESSVAVAVRV